MRKGIAVLVVAVLGSVATGSSPALSDDIDATSQSRQGVASPHARSVVMTDKRRLDLAAVPGEAAARTTARRPIGRHPRARGPIVVHREGCERDRDPGTHLEFQICSFGAYAKASLRPNATSGYTINWTEVAARAIGDRWCLSRYVHRTQVFTSRIVSSTPRGRLRPGPHTAAVRLRDESGNGLGRMWVNNVELEGGEIRGRVARRPKGDKASWAWNGSMRNTKTLRIVTATGVSFPLSDDGLIMSRERVGFRTASCGPRER